MMRTGNKMLRLIVVAAAMATTMLVFAPRTYSQDVSSCDAPQSAPSVVVKDASATSATAVQPEKIRVQLHWYPQSQFAGFLMAAKKGFFREEGLDVVLKWGGADIMPLRELKDGNAEFCTAWLSQAIASRTDENTPCVLLAQLMPRSSMMLVVRKNSGILTPVQMTGKKIGLWGGDFSIAPNSFFEKFNIKPVVIMQSSSVLPFIKGVVDAASAMSYNEYHKFLEAGMKEEELKTFMLADYGLDFPEDGIYTTVDFRKNHPDVCKKMMRAIRKGWQYSFDNIHETIEAVVQTANENNFVTNANHQQWMIKAMKELVPVTETKERPWGYLAPSTYSGVCNILQHQNLIKKTPPSYAEFYQPAVTPENVPAPAPSSAPATAPAAEGGDAK